MLQYDPRTNEIIYKGRVVGRMEFTDEGNKVRLCLEYSDDAFDASEPLSHLAKILRALEPPPPEVVFSVETEEEDIEVTYQVPRGLIEYIVRRDGYKWNFHMTDADPWPSPFHAHDYEKKLKLDVITGDIYDTMTRNKLKTMKRKSLDAVQGKVRTSSALQALVDAYLPKIEEEEEQ